MNRFILGALIFLGAAGARADLDEPSPAAKIRTLLTCTSPKNSNVMTLAQNDQTKSFYFQFERATEDGKRRASVYNVQASLRTHGNGRPILEFWSADRRSIDGTFDPISMGMWGRPDYNCDANARPHYECSPDGGADTSLLDAIAKGSLAGTVSPRPDAIGCEVSRSASPVGNPACRTPEGVDLLISRALSSGLKFPAGSDFRTITGRKSAYDSLGALVCPGNYQTNRSSSANQERATGPTTVTE